MGDSKLANLQFELLKIFAINLPEKQLLEIKDMLGRYFAQRATEEMDKLWEEKGWSAATMEEWANEHWRKPSTDAPATY